MPATTAGLFLVQETIQVTERPLQCQRRDTAGRYKFLLWSCSSPYAAWY